MVVPHIAAKRTKTAPTIQGMSPLPHKIFLYQSCQNSFGNNIVICLAFLKQDVMDAVLGHFDIACLGFWKILSLGYFGSVNIFVTNRKWQVMC